MTRIYELPVETLIVLTAVLFVGTYWVGCVFIRPLLRIFVRSRGQENAIVGNVMSAFGVLYGLLLSLIAVAAYQNLSEVDAEASALLALFRDVSEFPPPHDSKLRALLQNLCRSIVEEEWPIQRSGKIPLSAGSQNNAIRRALLDVEPTSERDKLLQAEAIKHFDAMTEHGRRRRYAAEAGIPTVMWYVVLLGTLINFVLLWLFDMRLITQLFLGGLLAFFLGALILLIAVLERPYRSVEFGVQPKAFELVQLIMRQATAAPAAVPTQTNPASED